MLQSVGGTMMEQIAPTFDWSQWLPLEGAGRNKSLPREAGIYRIRRVGQTSFEYVGQTGPSVGLRQRLGMLRGVYRPLMPYNDPHTAGPALWALKQLKQCEYEASVSPLTVTSTPLRKGLECVAIAQHRQGSTLPRTRYKTHWLTRRADCQQETVGA